MMSLPAGDKTKQIIDNSRPEPQRTRKRTLEEDESFETTTSRLSDGTGVLRLRVTRCNDQLHQLPVLT
jgi:hypothetical protein